jgi:hypothetical protein
MLIANCYDLSNEIISFRFIMLSNPVSRPSSPQSLIPIPLLFRLFFAIQQSQSEEDEQTYVIASYLT